MELSRPCHAAPVHGLRGPGAPAITAEQWGPPPSPAATPLAQEKPQAEERRNYCTGLSAELSKLPCFPCCKRGGPGSDPHTLRGPPKVSSPAPAQPALPSSQARQHPRPCCQHPQPDGALPSIPRAGTMPAPLPLLTGALSAAASPCHACPPACRPACSAPPSFTHPGDQFPMSAPLQAPCRGAGLLTLPATHSARCSPCPLLLPLPLRSLPCSHSPCPLLPAPVPSVPAQQEAAQARGQPQRLVLLPHCERHVCPRPRTSPPSPGTQTRPHTCKGIPTLPAPPVTPNHTAPTHGAQT